ncbi:MAG: NAD-dependent epimerase/dehydratase family protein [Candidatus Peregrinibacteria bacterium GW2011_GWA2_44_7]|nr:MAG: NAD-dependent epimerase/dehydratase family protein [Candidatus Peregrinibacteria bacterium GW2011_GWA2_44_7]
MAKENPEKNHNIVVTGGAGFIGSFLCEALLRKGANVICIDNFATGHVRNIEPLLQNPKFQFLRLDVNQPFNLEEYRELTAFRIPYDGISEIYHLACPTSIKQFDQFKIQTLLSNSMGNYHLLEMAVKYRSKILLASSSVVYGAREDQDQNYIPESSKGIVDHLSPRACYDEGRRFSETMFETYRQVHGIDIRIARIFRTYGPRMPLFDGHLIPDFILNAIEGKPLEIYGGEEFRTSLVYVDDVVDGLLRLMVAPDHTTPVNIGSDQDLLLKDVAQKIATMLSSASQITYKPQLPFLSELGLPDIRVAKDLGWLPLMRLEDGLKKTIDYIQANKIILTTL